MKKLMIASLGLSLLTGTAMFAQNTAGSTTADTMSGKKKTKKKKSKTESSSTTSTTK
ncbi:MAG: hypothetical protein ACJ74Y_14965 [Bryobacteraceae bacterium]